MKNRQQTNTNRRNLLPSKGSFVWPIIPFVGQNRPHIRPFVCHNRPFVVNWAFSRGFTLVELMITLVVAGVLLTLGVPSFQSFLMNNRMVSQANEIMGSLAYARSEAIKRAVTVTICKASTSGAFCSNTDADPWSLGGWLIYADLNNDGALTAGELLRVHEALSGNNVLTGTGNIVNSVSYSRLGLLAVGGGDTFTLCDSRGSTYGRTITLSATGRPGISREC